MGGLCPGGHGSDLVGTAGTAHGGRLAGQTLDAACTVAIFAGNTGAIHFGCTLLQGWLACPEGVYRQHGLVGVHWHDSGLDLVGVAVVNR